MGQCLFFLFWDSQRFTNCKHSEQTEPVGRIEIEITLNATQSGTFVDILQKAELFFFWSKAQNSFGSSHVVYFGNDLFELISANGLVHFFDGLSNVVHLT